MANAIQKHAKAMQEHEIAVLFHVFFMYFQLGTRAHEVSGSSVTSPRRGAGAAATAHGALQGLGQAGDRGLGGVEAGEGAL